MGSYILFLFVEDLNSSTLFKCSELFMTRTLTSLRHITCLLFIWLFCCHFSYFIWDHSSVSSFCFCLLGRSATSPGLGSIDIAQKRSSTTLKHNPSWPPEPGILCGLYATSYCGWATFTSNQLAAGPSLPDMSTLHKVLSLCY